MQQNEQEQRANACIAAMARGGAYALYQDKDWVMVVADDLPSMPIWADKDGAEAWQQAHYPLARVKFMPLKDWHNKWHNNLNKDKCLLLLSPLVDEEEGILVTADEFSAFVLEDR